MLTEKGIMSCSLGYGSERLTRVSAYQIQINTVFLYLPSQSRKMVNFHLLIHHWVLLIGFTRKRPFRINLLSSSVMTMIGLLIFPRPFEVEANTVML